MHKNNVAVNVVGERMQLSKLLHNWQRLLAPGHAQLAVGKVAC